MKWTTPVRVSLIAITAFLLYFPIVIIAIFAFNDSARTIAWSGFTLRWFAEIVNERSMFESIQRTWTIAIISTFIATIAGTFIAIGIHDLSTTRRRRILFLNNIPVVNPDVVTGISLMLVFGLIGIPFGAITMLFAHVFFSIPYVVLTVLPKLKQLDQNLYDAARDLGCSPFAAVRKVILPAVYGAVIAGGMIAFTMSIDDFVISYFTTGSGFTNFSNWIYSRLGRKSFSPAAYAYNSLISIVTISGLLLYNLRKKPLSKRG
jgi:spermidine/putrescine transport system permease protein